MSSEMGIRAYARHRGVTPAAVRKAIKTGRITASEGKIDPELADRQWAANTDESKPRNSVSGNPAGTQSAHPSLTRPTHRPPRWTPAPASSGGYATARAIRESYEARIRELDFKRMSGELVAVDDVRVAAYNTNRRARDLLLAIPDRVAAVIAGLTDRAQVHKILAEEFQRVCDELSNPLPFDGSDHVDRR